MATMAQGIGVSPKDSHAFGASNALDLLDWKRRIFALYAEVRAATDAETAWNHWRDVREELYRMHPQSPVPAGTRAEYGNAFLPYDTAFRVVATVTNGAPVSSPIAASTGGTFAFSRVGRAHFELHGVAHELELSWNEGYGGGILVAVADETSGRETYGGGRYVLDTVKGADLGNDGDQLVLDLNFAFNPSCAFDPRWACPLPPLANRLPLRLEVGERAP
jgi:uncharacterized protein (DUF1684 family)